MAENLWVRTSPTAGAPAEAEALPLIKPAPVGATSPQNGVRVPDQADRLPQRQVPHPALVWFLGVTGGAGESTLAALTRGARAADHAWPMPDRGSQSRVVLVARTNYAGLRAAQRAAIEWASNYLGDRIRLDGLVLIPDAPGRMPKELRELVQLVGGGVPHVWTMPWVDAWRFGPPDPATAPRELASMLADLHLQFAAPHH